MFERFAKEVRRRLRAPNISAYLEKLAADAWERGA
jgi:hypothetical protein